MIRKLFLSTLLATTLIGCASTAQDTSAIKATPAIGALANCNAPTLAERGPIRPSLFVIGTFPDGQWLHMENRQFGYKGDGIYQIVSEEKAGNVSLQFATMSWNPQFTAAGLAMTLGYEKDLKRGGFAKNTAVTIPEDGKYVWSVQFTKDKKPVKASIVKCN
jgi:hypothetical protein